jgi:hypothetical protein
MTKKKGEGQPDDATTESTVKSSTDELNSMVSLLLLTVYHLQGEVTTGSVVLSSPTWYYEIPRVVSRL